MIELAPAELESLAVIYLVANTPSYIDQHFRSHDAIRRLADRYSAAELVGTILEVDRLEERGVSDVVAAYAATVALIYKNPLDVDAAWNEHHVDHLRWVDAILKMGAADRVATATATYRMPKLLRDETAAQALSSTNRRLHKAG